MEYPQFYTYCPTNGSGSARCGNKTGIVIAYPILANNSYAWVAGLLAVVILVIVAVIATIVCCRRRRHSSEDDIVSVVRVRAALFENDRDFDQSTQALVPAEITEDHDIGKLSLSKGRVCMMLLPCDTPDGATLSADDDHTSEVEDELPSSTSADPPPPPPAHAAATCNTTHSNATAAVYVNNETSHRAGGAMNLIMSST